LTVNTLNGNGASRPTRRRAIVHRLRVWRVSQRWSCRFILALPDRVAGIGLWLPTGSAALRLRQGALVIRRGAAIAAIGRICTPVKGIDEAKD
jgi:hypothetical protein